MSQTMQATGFYRRRVGDMVVTALNDGVLDLPPAAMRGIDAQASAELLQRAFRAPAPRSSVNTFLVQGAGSTILIDAGAGGSMGPMLGKLQANLAAAGVGPENVDMILLTHLHRDHFGGLASATGEAVFPRAELVIPQSEADFWLDEAKAAAAPDDRRPTFTAARAAVAPYRERLRLFDGGDVAPGVTAHPLPGHTPGHSGYFVGSGNDRLLVWGDVVHVPDVQARRPEVGMVFDIDPGLAVQTRRDVLEMAARDRLMVAGMHMHFPAFSHIEKAAEGYAIVPVAWLGSV